MDIQDIQIFARIAALQNLSAVGNELGLTPGTISKRIQALEDELSVRLFERTTRSIRITEEGSRFLSHVERILSELDQARATVAESTSKPKGKLKIVASQALGRAMVGPAIVRFLTLYPDIDVHIDLTDRAVNLQEQGYDVAIHAGTLADSTLIAKRLATDRQILVAAPSYIAECGAPQTLEDIARCNCLAQAEAWTWTFQDRSGTESNVRINARLRSDNFEMLREAALMGQGLLLASTLHIRSDLDSGALLPVLPDFDVPQGSGVWALYPSSKHVMPRLRVFLNFLGEWFRDPNARIAPAAPIKHEPMPAAGV